MQINKVLSSAASDISKRVGHALLDNKPSNANLKRALHSINNFVQGESYNPGNGAYYTLISAFVLIPRLMQAREPDEFREVLTRDVVTILTILYAMKGLKTGMCSKAQKDSGLVLLKEVASKNPNPKFKRVVPLTSDEIIAKYSDIGDRSTLVNTLKSVDKDGGCIGKMFTVEKRKKEGVLDVIKRVVKRQPKDESKPLYEAAKKMFGNGFEEKTNAELIQAVEDITPENVEAFDGLKEIVGKNALQSRSFDITEGVKEDADGILNNENNPLTYYARNIASNFETLSLAITAGFLGFGLPKLNEFLTKQKHLNKPAGTSTRRASKPEVIGKGRGQIYSSIKNASMASTFQSFMGNSPSRR